jgi:hypothetical protein
MEKILVLATDLGVEFPEPGFLRKKPATVNSLGPNAERISLDLL